MLQPPQTVRKLFDQQRKPDGQCGCEDDIRATMTMLLNRYLFNRPGFEHNSEYDEIRSQYFATHCTCATKLNGPTRRHSNTRCDPFFHHLPKTPALDVQWTPGTPVHSLEDVLGE